MADDRAEPADSSAGDLSPSDFSTRGIPTARRGYEKKAVDGLVAAAVARWSELHRLYTELLEEVSRMGGADYLARELGAIGAEVGRILQAAEEAAAALKERALEYSERVHAESSAEAENLLAEAVAEAGRLVAEAQDQAVETRRTAWEEGTSLLTSALAQSEAMLDEARQEALRLRGEGEREAHRRLAATRKEAEDIVRTARAEADRQLELARGIAAEMADEGSAAGDTQAAREALAAIDRLRVGRSIEGVAVLPAEPAPPLGVDPYESRRQGAAAGSDLSDTLAAEVERLAGSAPAPPGDEGAASSGGDAGLREIGTLFDALRSTAGVEASGRPGRRAAGPIERRDRVVLGLQNAGLREVKRRIADIQEGALADLKGPGWTPSGDDLASGLAPLLEPLIARAAAAGAEAARLAVGVEGDPAAGGRPAALARSMTDDLESQLRAALSAESGGPEETAATVSRVFRAWRTDELERWIGSIVNAAYHDAMLSSLASGGFARVRGVPSGVPCPGCPGAAGQEWDIASPPPAGVPPINLDCRCSFEPVGE